MNINALKFEMHKMLGDIAGRSWLTSSEGEEQKSVLRPRSALSEGVVLSLKLAMISRGSCYYGQ